MTPPAELPRHQRDVYNAGVRDALALAKASADRLRPQLETRLTRIGFAVDALDGLAIEGKALLLPTSEG